MDSTKTDRARLFEIVDICGLDGRQSLDEFLEGPPESQYLQDFLAIKQRLGTEFEAAFKAAVDAMPQVRQKALHAWVFRDRHPLEDDDDYAERLAEQRRIQNPWGS